MSERLRRLRKQKRRLEEEERLKHEAFELPQGPVLFSQEILKFNPTPYQRKLLLDRSNRISLRFSRQSGKTTTIAIIAIWFCATHPNKLALIVAPGLRQSMIVMDRVYEHIARMEREIKNRLIEKKQRTKITFRNGSVIIALPCSENLLRGYTADLILADEAAFFAHDEYMFNNVLMPMLATTNGTLIVSSTPWSSKSQFYEFCKGKSKERFSQHHITWRQAVEAGLMKKEFIDDMQDSMLPQQFTMEFEAEFVEDVNAWLPQDLISRCIDAELEFIEFEGAPTGEFFVGVDLGKHQDYSVVVVVNKQGETIRLVHCHRFPLETKYASVIGYVKTLTDRWKTIRKTLVDQTGVGDYVVEDMKNSGIANVEGVTFTQQNKEEWAVPAKQAMLQGNVKLPYDRELIDELNVERYELTKTGHYNFFHPEGTNDDRFWAFVLAVYGARSEAAPGPIIAKTFD